MPIVKPPRSLSAVRCVRKTRDKNGDVRYDLRVLFDYVMNIKNINDRENPKLSKYPNIFR